MPSLSTTSSLHLIRRDEEVSSFVASSARSLRVAGMGTDDSLDSVVVLSEFDAGGRDRDILIKVVRVEELKIEEETFYV